MINYNKTNIIVLALLYNYLANKETIITKRNFEIFFSELNYELLLKEKKLISEEEREQNVYKTNENVIQLNVNNLPYSLVDIKRKYIDLLPCEVIEASLSKDVLCTLKINRNDINTKTCVEPKCFSDNDKMPSNDKTKKIIKLNTTAFPTTFTGNVCLSVEREVIDLDPIIEEYETKQK